MAHTSFRNDPTWFAILAMFGFSFTMLGAWLTHVVVCIKTAQWLFLIAGAVAAPVGVIHGIGIWFGAW